MKEGYTEISLEHIAVNSTLAYPIYDKDDNEILPGHTILTKEKINSLIKSGITKVYYLKEAFNKKKSAIKTYLNKNSYTGPRSISSKTQNKGINLMGDLVDAIKNYLIDFKSDDLNELVNAINKDLDENQQEVVNLLDVIDFDDYTYTHSLNVGIISMVFARNNRLPKDVIRDIGIGGFLHDIGKIRLPKEIVNKTEELTPQEYTLLQEHSLIGYDIIKNDYFFSDLVKEIVLSHHERKDGNGYPNKLSGKEISNEIEIVSLADLFDSLTTEKPYRKSIDTRTALEQMLTYTNLFSKTLLKQFVKDMVIVFRESNFYPVGSYVILNTNELANVITIDKTNFFRPTINIISNQHGKRLNKPISVDLKIDYSRNIIKRIG